MMKHIKIIIYPLLKTSRGYCPGEAPVAEVSLVGGKTVISCHDGALKEKIHQIFITPLHVRRITGEIPRLFSHCYEDIMPHTESFFNEIVYALKDYKLYGDQKRD